MKHFLVNQGSLARARTGSHNFRWMEPPVETQLRREADSLPANHFASQRIFQSVESTSHVVSLAGAVEILI